MHSGLASCAVLCLVAITACDKSSSSSSSTTAGSATQPLTANSANAGGHERGRPGGEGSEMFDACTGKAAGTACTVKMRDKDMTGTCTAMPGGGDGKLMCKIEGGPGEHAPPGAASH